MSKKISIIIPVYKVEQYLDECVKSVVNQIYKNLEIILVDDGSPDDSGKMCDEWAKKDNRIVVLHKKNGGLSSARNAGLSVATGDYIAFLDSDDFIATEMCDVLGRMLESHPEACMVGCPFTRNANGKYSIFKIGDVDYQDGKFFTIKAFMDMLLSRRIDSASTNKIYRHDFIKHKFTEGRTAEDLLFLYNNCKENYFSNMTFLMCSTPFYYYRVRVDSICVQDKRYINPMHIDAIKNTNEIIEDIKKWNQSLLPLIYKRQEQHIIIEKKQLVLTEAVSREKYPEMCQYIDDTLNSISVFRKGMAMKIRIKIFICKYAPFLWKLKDGE